MNDHTKLLTLIDAFGDACFDCGEWQLDHYTDKPYEELLAVEQSARQALIDAIAVQAGNIQATSITPETSNTVTDSCERGDSNPHGFPH